MPNQMPQYHPPAPPSPPSINTFDPMKAIIMRLRLPPSKAGDVLWHHINAYVDDTTACVFIVPLNGKPVLLEDDPNMFPSDNLITQLRLLMP